MRYKLTFAVGFAVGYTFGAKAGEKRYEQIMSLIRGAAENPAVQSAAGVLQGQASEMLHSAQRTVRDTVAHTVSGRHTDSAPPPYPGAHTPTSGGASPNGGPTG